jgi:CubicO group peptidase (beta-lactamase class C family)
MLLLVLLVVAIASPVSASEWRAAYGLSSNDFGTLSIQLQSQGFRPVSLDGNGTAGNPHIASTWIKDGFTNWQAQVGMSATDYQNTVSSLAGQGYRLLCVDTYDSYPNERYAAVWVKDGLGWGARNRLTSAQYQTEFVNFANAGYRPISMSASGSGANTYFSAVWVFDAKPSIGRHNMTAAGYQSFLDSFQTSGFRPVSVTGYGVVGSPQFGALWVEEEQPEWGAFYEQSSLAFASTFIAQTNSGFRPTAIVEYGSAADPRYASLWQKDPPARIWQITGVANLGLTGVDRAMTNYMQSRNISRASLALTKDGRLAFSRAYTWAPTNTPATSPTNLFRIASLSKSITSAAVFQLVESGLLGLDQKVSTVLDLTNVVDGRFPDVTVRQLLQHWGGWDRAVSFDPMFYDYSITNALHLPLPTTPEMVLNFMKNQPLDFTPGARYAYSNFGYSLLGLIIERLSRQPYEQYVRENLLAPMGIFEMRVGQSLLGNKLPAEVDYDDPLRRWAGSVMGPGAGRVPIQYGGWNLRTMDSHGGWVASASDLVRFITAFDTRTNSPLLSATNIDLMWSRPPGQSLNDSYYYAAGWQVRPINGQSGLLNAWHSGLLDGTFTYFVRLYNGLDWVALFNKSPSVPGVPDYDAIDPEINAAIAGVTSWPTNNLFDSDENGLLDSWELYYFGSIGVNPRSDADGDGASNLAEYIAQTDPLNPADSPKLEISKIAGGTTVLRWDAKRGRSYNFDSSSKLADPPTWTPLTNASSSLGKGAIQFWTNSLSGPDDQFYRMGVRIKNW